MDINRIEELAFQKMGKRYSHSKREKGYIYYHGLRTAKLSIEIRKIIDEIDDSKDNIIYVSALFHDIAKGIEPHNENGSILIKQILKDECSYEKLMEIAEIIRCHNLRSSNEDWPKHIRIVQDADMLDHMGTMDVWLNFVYQAYDEKSVDASIEFYNDEEFKYHLEDCRRKLNYDISKKIFDDRIEFIHEFIVRLNIEGKGGIFNKDLLRR
ncbi:MAG: HD domain-containing protein [Tissierellia bacterium]|nr:HD domain-containing protein [Tissierellia bacterium]